jgi:hypothetical protein
VCAKGYSSSVGYQCTPCKTGAKAAIYSALALLLLVFILLISYLVIQLLGLSDGQDAASNGVIGFHFIKKIGALPWAKQRIPIVAFQIVTQYINVTGLPLPDIYRNFLAWTDVFNLNLGWLLSLGCLANVNFYQKLLIITLGPFAVVAALACTYSAVRRRNQVQAVTVYSSQRAVTPARTARLDKALAQHQLVFLAMTFLIYSTVSTTVFQTFACDQVDDVVDVKTHYLRADYSIQCGTAKHTLYKVYAAIMIFIYPIGIPALYTWLLWRNKHKLTSKNDGSLRILNRHDDVTLRSTRFLWKSYTPRMYYWEVLECLRRLLLTGAVVFIEPDTPAQAAIACVLAVVSMMVAMYYKPHAEALDGRIYVVGALIIFLSMFLSSAMKTDVTKEDHSSQDAFAVVLVLLNVAMVLAAVSQMALVGHRAYLARDNSVLGLRRVDNTTDDTDINDGTSTKSSADDDDVENDQQATTVAHQQQCTAVEVVAQQSEMKF